MFARIAHLLCLGFLACAPLFAQEADNTDMQDMRQQLQQLGREVMQNMLQQGIDPREFFGDIRQQVQDGTFDMEALQQKLVDRGLIDKETVAQMQTKAQSATLNSIRKQLEATDAEWAILLPKIQRVIVAIGDADNSNPMRGLMSGFTRGPLPKSDVVKSKQELQAVLANPAATPADLQAKLAALREAGRKAREELAAAQKDLQALLSVRQESVLVLLGLF